MSFCETTEPLGLKLLYSSNKESDIKQCQDQKCKCKLKVDSNQSYLNRFAKRQICLMVLFTGYKYKS